MTLYETLKAAGCTLDNWCSSLYVKLDDVSRQILAEARRAGYHVETFISQIDHQPWCDVFGAYDPFWPKTQPADTL